MDEGAIGRYQIVVVGKEGAVLLDTATGSSWSLARDIDTLQLAWRPLHGHLPAAVLHGASERAPPSSREDAGEAPAAPWRLRRGPRPQAAPMLTRPEGN